MNTLSHANTGTSNMEQTPRVYSAELLGRGRELRILHRGEEYRLRLTSTNKLLLTK